MSGYYPYLLCGLPDLSFDMDLSGFNYEEISSTVNELLSEKDREALSLFLAPGTHRQMAKKYLSLQDEEERTQYLSENLLPRYQKKIFAQSLPVLLYGEEDHAVELDVEEAENALVRILDGAFYTAVLRHGNPFMRRWFEFDGVLKNVEVAFAARKQGRAAENEFVEEASAALVQWIKENMQEGDFGLKLRLAYAQEMFSALNHPDVFERERAVDRFRWNMAEEMVREKDFQLDKVLCYMLKAGILRRWQNMDAASGREYLRETVSEMRKVNLRGENA